MSIDVRVGIVAVEDGATVIPLDGAPQVLQAARAAVAREAGRLAANESGELYNPSIDPALRAAKVIE